MIHSCMFCGNMTENINEAKDFMSTSFVDTYGNSEIHICDKCKEELFNIDEWQNEQFRENTIICPWCGYQYEEYDSYEFEEGEYIDDDLITCPECGQKFELEVEYLTYFTTKKPKEFYSR